MYSVKLFEVMKYLGLFYEVVSKSFRSESIMKYKLTTINTR